MISILNLFITCQAMFLLTSRFMTLKPKNMGSKITVFNILTLRLFLYPENKIYFYKGCIDKREECIFLFVDSDILLPLGLYLDFQISFSLLME